MQSLINHARIFPARIAGHRERFAALTSGQQPLALFVSCSDSRVMPALFTGAGPGEIFELRTAGNIIPRYRPRVSCAVAGTLEYAIECLSVSDIVICGHTHCGAVQGLVNQRPLRQMPLVERWLTVAGFGQRDPVSPDLHEEGRRHLAAQVVHARTYPFVARRLAAGRLRLHAWFYAVDTGEITVRLPDTGAFVPL
ncbi:carbonic anhydrase [Actinoplanes sp. ATCC 53533]|uniref:carbonic anhydrase n=1 Tax=Actinoplanes sp. ATCC 53533 TaxID=1288362 RepID=UPI000F798EE7|nr:carbonic anhydrase [Actinoplanes sp. ATCC 53533]RSM42894.1 carbonic anhydrase [Actinoplanes sp. ATCC 53533]